MPTEYVYVKLMKYQLAKYQNRWRAVKSCSRVFAFYGPAIHMHKHDNELSWDALIDIERWFIVMRVESLILQNHLLQLITGTFSLKW